MTLLRGLRGVGQGMALHSALPWIDAAGGGAAPGLFGSPAFSRPAVLLAAGYYANVDRVQG